MSISVIISYSHSVAHDDMKKVIAALNALYNDKVKAAKPVKGKKKPKKDTLNFNKKASVSCLVAIFDLCTNLNTILASISWNCTLKFGHAWIEAKRFDSSIFC